ncbi:hypothetical protein F5Y15DRAFT_106750 [Xylariaceae sp. FL0016]|nr:hypothetical protein F5Y15DRAFT_106750 [Xylariaceae sp. FL0016]
MCEIHVYKKARSNGRVEEYEVREPCRTARHGYECREEKIYVHPSQAASHQYDNHPPTPPLSSHSAVSSDSERTSKRRSGFYVHDDKYLDIHRKPSRNDKNKRPVYVNDYSPSRSPPRQHTPPRSPPSSAYSEDPIVHEVRYRPEEHHRNPSPHLKGILKNATKAVEPTEEHQRHRRQPSSKTSSQDSKTERTHHRRRSSVHYADDKRDQRDAESKIESKIARQNDNIARRPAKPVVVEAVPAPIPAPTSNSSRYRRGSVVVAPSFPSTIDHRHLSQRAEEKQKKREEEEQRQRLAERFIKPSRRASVSVQPGQGRPQVYVYR